MDANSSLFTSNKSQPDHPLLIINDESASINVRRPNDPFLFYSIDANLQNAMSLKPVDYSNDGSKSSIPIVRKTRLSFEKDPLSIMIDALAEDFSDGSRSSISIVRNNKLSFEKDPLLSLMIDTLGEDFFDLCKEEVGAISSRSF